MDSAQLPPVNHSDSIPFKKNNYDFLELTLNEPLRQSLDNPIIDVATQIRNNLILQDPIRDLITTEFNNKGIKVFNKTTQRSELKEVIKTLITDPHFQEDTNFVKILAWRNTVVKKLNSICRNILYGTTERFVVGDKLVAQKALFRIDSVNTRHRVQHFYKLVCNTSDEFTVTGVDVVTKTFKEDSYELVKFTGSFWKLDVNITNKENEHFVLYVIHESSLEDYKQVLRKAKNQTIGVRSSDPWIAYYNILKWSDNVDYNYALTVHRSQGSTFKNVVLIEEDIELNPRIIEKNRMRYTAYTRASDYIYTLK